MTADRDRVADGYDQAADGYDQRHGDRRSRARARVLDRALIDAGRGKRVLELGVGTGRLLIQVPAPVRIGVDVSAGMLTRARALGLSVARADAHLLPFATGAFDAVVAGKGVFRYLDLDRALAEVVRVLSAGGVLALHQYGARTLARRSGHDDPAPAPAPAVRELDDVAELVDAAAAHGLTAVAVHRYRPIRIPPYLLSIPAWIDRRVRAQLWGHLVAVFRLGDGAADAVEPRP